MLIEKQHQNTNFVKPATWLDLLVISVISISIVAVVLLVLDFFNPKTAVFVGIAIAIPIFFISSFRLDGIADVRGVGIATIATIVFVALIFRADPYPWINGGQDQGVYVSMSSYYQHGGKIFVEDNVLPHLLDTELKSIYTNNRSKYQFVNQYYPGLYYGGAKDYVFQFYHLHSLWMAIFAEFFGDDARNYALTFFSVLSIVFLGLLTFDLSKSRLAALSASLLIAINPLHVFFSNWPVTEVVVLGFSSIGLYYLARSNELLASREAARLSLFVGCLSLSLLFFVRISGFLYLPLLAIIFMIGGWQYKTKENSFGFDLMIFSLACILFYFLSVMYGLKYSPNYSNDIYRLTFGKIISGKWYLVMTAGFLTMLAIMFSWFHLVGYSAFVSRVRPLVQPRVLILGMLFFIIVAASLSLYKVYQVGFSDTYKNHPLGIRWQLSGSGIRALVQSSFINWLAYTSPVLVLFGGIAMLSRSLDFRLALMTVIVGVSLGVFIITNPILPYQYYYARYLVSESVPYAIICCVVAMFNGVSQSWRRLGIVAVIITIPIFGYFTFKQFGAEEGIRPLSILRKIAAHVDDGDVLLIEPEGWSIPRYGVEEPLRIYFGIKTFKLPTKQINSVVGKKLAKSFRNIWLLTPTVIDDDRFVLEERLLHYDKVVERVGHIPMKIVDDFWHQELFLYSMKKLGYPSSPETYKIDFSPNEISRDSYETRFILGDGWHAVENAHVWSTGMSIINLKNTMFINNKLPSLMKLEIAPYAATKDRPVMIEVYVGNRRLEFEYKTSARKSIEIPVACSYNHEQCTIKFLVKNAASPKDLGQSSDVRILGFALYSFSFE